MSNGGHGKSTEEERRSLPGLMSSEEQASQWEKKRG
jgi:hypothetical protein